MSIFHLYSEEGPVQQINDRRVGEIQRRFSEVLLVGVEVGQWVVFYVDFIARSNMACILLYRDGLLEKIDCPLMLW